jgi:DNA-binding NarL/FixJ family response regulator
MMPQLKVIMVTVLLNEERLCAALRAGAAGYLQKPFSLAMCFEAIRGVVGGGTSLCARAGRVLVKATGVSLRSQSGPVDLTDREREIVDLLAEGKTDKEIGAVLGISPATVHIHLVHIYDKLGAHSRVDAVVRYQRLGS